MAKNTAQGSSARGAPRSPAPAPEPSSASAERLARLESLINDVRQALNDRIESQSREIAGLKRTQEIREIQGYVRVEEFNELRRNFENFRNYVRQDAQYRTPSQQLVERERNPIPMYSGDRRDLPNFINRFFSWTVTQRVEQALTYEVPVLMTTKQSRAELDREYGGTIVDKSLCVWAALTKAIEKDRSISDMVMNAKAPSQAWTILTSMVEDENSVLARENAESDFESLSMIVNESAREYVARAKGLARAVEYHGVEVAEEKICRRILNGLPSSMHLVREVFAELEQALINKEALNKRSGGAVGHALAAGFRRNQRGRRGGSGGRHKGRSGRDGAHGRRGGRRDGGWSSRRQHYRPPSYQYQHQQQGQYSQPQQQQYQQQSTPQHQPQPQQYRQQPQQQPHQQQYQPQQYQQQQYQPQQPWPKQSWQQHQQSQQPQQQQHRDSGEFCERCRQPGHRAANCMAPTPNYLGIVHGGT